MRAILDEDAPLPEGWGNSQAMGMSVYRGNYRSALMSALEDTYERTARYVGEGPFQRVAVHHAMSHPPSGWTIEEAGEGFEATCAELFGNNPEVAELAWLEWAMLQLSSAPDHEPMTAQDFAEASSGFGDAEWMGLTVQFRPRGQARVVRANLTSLWNALEEGADQVPAEPLLPAARGCIVSREGERPTFQMVDPADVRAFVAMQDGAAYGDLIGLLAGEGADAEAVQNAAMQAGQMLGGWLAEGLVISLDA